MKILWVSEFPPDKGAVADYSYHLLKKIASKSDQKIDILSISGEETEEISENEQLSVIGKIPEDSSDWKKYFDREYDLVHFQYHLPYLREFLKYKLKGGQTPELIVTLHDVPTDLKHKLMFSVFRNEILLTEETEKKFRENFPLLTRLLRHRVFQAPYLGIDRELDERVRSKQLETEVSDDKVNIVCPGFIHEKKGFHKVVEALPEVLKQFDAELTFAGGLHREGSQEYLDKIRGKIEENGLEDRVSITGVLPSEDHVNRYIRRADVVALPFDDISQSATLTKTLALGTVPVVTPIETLEPAIQKYGGLMIEEDSREALEKGLIEALKNPPGIDAEKIREDLSWENNAERYLEVYEELNG